MILLLLIIPNGTSELERIFSVIKALKSKKKTQPNESEKTGRSFNGIILLSRRRELQQRGALCSPQARESKVVTMCDLTHDSLFEIELN